MSQNEHLAKVFSRVACDPCSSKYEQRAEDPDFSVEEIVESIVPPLYRSTEVSRLPFPDLLGSITSWRYSPGARGLWITGETRAGKTRSLCLLLDRLVREKVEIRAFFHGSFSDELLEVMRSDRNFRRWKKEIAAAPLLVIDDLFAEKLTERTETALFEVIDERIAHLRPTIATTQVTGADAQVIFHSKDRLKAFFARIREFFSVITLEEKQGDNFAGGMSASPTSHHPTSGKRTPRQSRRPTSSKGSSK